MHNGRAEKIRLWGIDCPEKTQPFGTKARQFTGDAAFGKTVTVKVMDVDRYGRTVGVVYLPNGKALNDELVRAGLAWWYRQYSPAATYLGRYEQQGKAARRGLWVDGNPTPPWDYRRR
jgi:endonuclease YncB( thermonuclease family)